MIPNFIRSPLVKLLKTLKTYPRLVSIKRSVWKRYFDFKGNYFDFNRLNVCRTFPLFTPHSAGSYKDLSRLTLQGVNETIPLLSAFEIKKYFDKYGSDKGSNGYHNVYGPILKKRDEITGILEIGLGTNNIDVVSNMALWGTPGASLRAFREFLKSANIFGADIDRRILFEEERIETFFVDQTDAATFAELGKSLPSDLDLVIDDGLHSPNANIATLTFGLSKIKIGAWVVVEDIAPEATPVWELVAALLPVNYQSHLLRGESAFVFAVKRTG